jgi:hypothetical protein
MNKETVVEYLLNRLEICENALRDLCKEKSEVFKRILETPYNDLPLLINEEGLLRLWASERIKNPDKWETPQCYIEFLSDEEMSYDEYRSLGVNDGELNSIAGVFSLLGMIAEAQRAYASVYTE